MKKKNYLYLTVILAMSFGTSINLVTSSPDIMVTSVASPVATISLNTLNLEWNYEGCDDHNFDNCSSNINDGYLIAMSISMTMKRAGQSTGISEISATILSLLINWSRRITDIENTISFDLSPYIAALGYDMLSADVTVTFDVLYYNYIWERHGTATVVAVWTNIPLIIIIIVGSVVSIISVYYIYRYYSRRKVSKIDATWCISHAREAGFIEANPDCNKYLPKPEKVKQV